MDWTNVTLPIFLGKKKIIIIILKKLAFAFGVFDLEENPYILLCQLLDSRYTESDKLVLG